MLYPEYATISDVSDFTGIAVVSLPVDVNTLIARASDLITNHIIITITDAHNEALRLATCAQVEEWMKSKTNENADQIQSYSAGSVSVTYANAGKAIKPLCTRARGYLNKAGLLYRGVRTC